MDRRPRVPPGPALLLAAASSLVVMTGAAVAPALSAIGRRFVDDPALADRLALVLTLPALMVGIAGAPVGLAVDRWGRTPVLRLGLALIGLAGVAGAAVEDLHLLLVTRAVVGVGAAAVMTAASTLLVDHYEGHERAAALSAQAVAMGIGGIVWPALGGLLADIDGRAPFLLFLVAPALLAGAGGLRDRVVESGPRGEVAAPTPVALLVAQDAAAFVGMALFYLIPVQSSFLVAERLGAPASAAGAAIALCTLPGLLLSSALPRLVARLRPLGVLALTFTSPAVGFLLLASARSWLSLAAGMVLCGVGFGVLVPNLALWQSTRVAPTVRGRAMAALTLAFSLGQFASPVLARLALGTQPDLAGLFLAAASATPVLGAVLLPAVALLDRRSP